MDESMMANPSSQSGEEAEGKGSRLLGWIILAVFPPFLMLVVIAAKFSGLSTPSAWDRAQLARNIAAGEGFVTDFIRPLSLVFRTGYEAHPDLYQAPVHPLLLALFYQGFRPSEKVTAAAGGFLWLLSVWLTFWIAYRWFGLRTAAWATLFYAANVRVLQSIMDGGSAPLMALGILLALALAFPVSTRKAGFQFRQEDLTRPRFLARRLREGADPLSQYLHAHLSLYTQQLLAEYDVAKPPSQALQEALLEDLNRWLLDPDLYDSQRFAGVRLSEEAQTLLERNPQGKNRILLHRLLLEQAYPEAFVQISPDEEEAGADLAGWRLALVGMACSLVLLTHYLLGTVIGGLGIYLGFSQRRKRYALGWFLTGFLIPLLPWMIRNFYQVGSPFFSLFWYEMLTNTSIYPGESLWRMATPPPPPMLFFFQHPLSVFRKFLAGLHQFWETAFSVGNPAVGFLLLASLIARTDDPIRRGLRTVGGFSLIGVVMGLCLFRFEPHLLLAWAPWLAILGATFLSEQILPPSRGLSRAGRWRRWGASLGTVGLVGFPLFYYLGWTPPDPPPSIREAAGTLHQLLPPEAVVMTNRPGPVAWYADRPTVWLCQRETDWEILERTGGPIQATYMVPRITRLPPIGQREWWVWLALPRGVYRDLVVAEEQPPRGVLRVQFSSSAP